MAMGIGLWILLALAISVLAAREFGRSGPGWFFLALLLSPLSGLLLFLLPARRRLCPHCGHAVDPQALLCRACGKELFGQQEVFGLPKTTRIVLVVLVVAVLASALGHCGSPMDGPREAPRTIVAFVVPFFSAVC